MKDARLDELRFLTQLERDGSLPISLARGAEAAIAIRLIFEGVLVDPTTVRSPVPEILLAQMDDYAKRIDLEKWRSINSIYLGQETLVRATHAAAVRRAQLEQSIVRDRLRDPTGILFDGRYADRDLSIGVFTASKDEPLTVAYLDLNGLKQLNDQHGHAAGDEAIRVYFEVIAEVIAQVGAAYRLGGDEVMILIENKPLPEGTKLLRAILRGLGNHRVQGRALSAVAGVTAVTDPSEPPSGVKARADQIQYRAKERSKIRPPIRFGALAIDGEDAVEEFEPTGEMRFSETEQLALRGIEPSLKGMFAFIVMPLCMSAAPLWMPATDDEVRALRECWRAAVAEKRWERMFMDQVKTESGGNVAGRRLIEHMIRAFRGVVTTASAVLGRFGSSGGSAIQVIAALEVAVRSAANVLTAEGSGNPATPGRLTTALEKLFDTSIDVLDQCWRVEHQGERGIYIELSTQADAPTG